MSTLAEKLAAAAPRLGERVLDETYRDPFWLERFGARGRAHSRADGDFHVRYLVAALHGGDAVFTAYARWLREVLVARGMCSLHLRDHFERLARAIADEGWADGSRAIALLQAGVDALAHRGDAATVDSLLPVVGAAAAHVDPGPEHPDAVEREMRQLASFVADSLAGGRDRLMPHVAFLGRAHAARGVARGRLDRELEVLATIAGMPAAARGCFESARSRRGAREGGMES